jgi:hypothetical protein
MGTIPRGLTVAPLHAVHALTSAVSTLHLKISLHSKCGLVFEFIGSRWEGSLGGFHPYPSLHPRHHQLSESTLKHEHLQGRRKRTQEFARKAPESRDLKATRKTRTDAEEQKDTPTDRHHSHNRALNQGRRSAPGSTCRPAALEINSA